MLRRDYLRLSMISLCLSDDKEYPKNIIIGITINNVVTGPCIKAKV